MPVDILYLFRRSSPNFHSIESLFSTIRQGVSESLSTATYEVKKSGAYPSSLIINFFDFLRSREKKAKIIHITGDIHYMGILTGRKTILTVHDIHSALKGGWLKRLYILMFWFWLPALRVRYITVISEFTRQELASIIAFAKHKIRVVPNPLSPDFSYSPKTEGMDSRPLILCVGTKENKNLERVIESISTLDCSLSIIGQLSQAQRLLLEAHRISYTSAENLSQEQVVAAYRECDLLCFPSTYEGFGMPIIEAQATGRPVLTSDLGAMKEVARETACIVDPYDVESIRQGIQRIISDQAYRENLIEKGLENVKRFDAKVIAESYMKLYREMVEKG